MVELKVLQAVRLKGEVSPADLAATVDARVLAVIDTAGQQIPRLRGYADKLEAALGKIRTGDTVWLSEPVVDSYHTAWFELHEELLIAADVTPARDG